MLAQGPVAVSAGPDAPGPQRGTCPGPPGADTIRRCWPWQPSPGAEAAFENGDRLHVSAGTPNRLSRGGDPICFSTNRTPFQADKAVVE